MSNAILVENEKALELENTFKILIPRETQHISEPQVVWGWRKINKGKDLVNHIFHST